MFYSFISSVVVLIVLIVSTEAQINRYLYRKGQPQGIAPTSRP